MSDKFTDHIGRTRIEVDGSAVERTVIQKINEIADPVVRENALLRALNLAANSMVAFLQERVDAQDRSIAALKSTIEAQGRYIERLNLEAHAQQSVIDDQGRAISNLKEVAQEQKRYIECAMVVPAKLSSTEELIDEIKRRIVAHGSN